MLRPEAGCAHRPPDRTGLTQEDEPRVVRADETSGAGAGGLEPPLHGLRVDRDGDAGGNEGRDGAESERDRDADSAGTGEVPIVRVVRRAAPTWPPTTPPIIRTTVFMPPATPISRGSTLSAIRPAMAAKAEPTPQPRSALASRTGPGSSCAVANRNAATLTTSIPAASGHLEP
jgi:hypothetical protein